MLLVGLHFLLDRPQLPIEVPHLFSFGERAVVQELTNPRQNKPVFPNDLLLGRVPTLQTADIIDTNWHSKFDSSAYTTLCIPLGAGTILLVG